MTKLKKKLTVIVAIFAAIAILGSTAAVFVGTRTNNNDQEVITSPVGYLEGVGTGTGKYATNPNTWVFAENDTSVFNLATSAESSSKPIYCGAKYNVSESVDSTYKLTSDSNGNGYVEATTYVNQDSAAFSFPVKNSAATYANRSGTYIIEFDIMIPEEPELDYDNYDMYFLRLALSCALMNGENDYSRLMLHDSAVDGYYYVSANESTFPTDDVLLKYGEWYNFRIEYKLDNTSYLYCKLFVNDVSICSRTMRYSGSTPKEAAPQYFRFVPRQYAHGMTWCIDNVYTYCSKK